MPSLTETKTDCVKPVHLTGTYTYQSPRLDAITHTLIVMDFVHHEIHDGTYFFCSDYDSDVDTGAPKYYRFTTPNTTTWGHFNCKYSSSGAGTWQFYENPTLNAAGTAWSTFNANRNSATTAAITAFYDTTTTSDGTLLWTDRTGADGGGLTRSSGNGSREEELMLKQNEDYILKFTPDADNAKVIVNCSWYEHVSKTA